jgi:hypothetical protein
LEAKKVPVWGVVLSAAIGLFLLMSAAGCADADSVQPNQQPNVYVSSILELYNYSFNPVFNSKEKPESANLNRLSATDLYQINQISKGADSISRYTDLGTDNLQKVETISKSAAGAVIDQAEQAISIGGNTASTVRQTFDHPISKITEKILTDKSVMKFIGIKSHEQINGDAGTANVYVVESNGLLSNIMDGIIRLLRCQKAGGGTLYPIGIFITEISAKTEILPHEYCHYYQQSVLGFGSWIQLYSGEITIRTIVNKDIYSSYKQCSWEQSAIHWAKIIYQSGS